MKKRIKKKHELLERIEYLENFAKHTVEIIEILADRVKHLGRKHKKH